MKQHKTKAHFAGAAPINAAVSARVQQLHKGFVLHMTKTDEDGVPHTKSTHHRIHPSIHKRLSGIMAKHGISPSGGLC